MRNDMPVGSPASGVQCHAFTIFDGLRDFHKFNMAMMLLHDRTDFSKADPKELPAFIDGIHASVGKSAMQSILQLWCIVGVDDGVDVKAEWYAGVS